MESSNKSSVDIAPTTGNSEWPPRLEILIGPTDSEEIPTTHSAFSTTTSSVSV